MDRPIVAVVLAGGRGTRLYPASTAETPKQLRSLGGDRSLLQATVDRCGFADEVYVLTRPDLARAVHEQVPGTAVLTEPAPRDTGPALVYAAVRIREQVGECVLACLPSDHHVEGPFADTLDRATRAAVATGSLVTIGVQPSRPATGYGYIEPAEPPTADAAVAVSRFVEKPDRETAATYVEAGWLWNAGLFCWTPTRFLAAVRDSPLASLADAVADGEADAGFAAVEAVSVDHAVLERAEDVRVLPADFAWDDLGDWDAVGRIRDADGDGNVRLGDGLALDSSGCVLATDGHVSVVGVDDLVVASYDGRTLVVPRDRAQAVREVVARRDAAGRDGPP
jgi:mannose-1-phosphate guanylyltransferase